MLIISTVTWMNNFVLLDPKDEAMSFLTDVRSGSLAKSVKHFGGNACHCPAKGGWGSYLIYASGQEPNLAFMTGHPVEFGQPKETPMQNVKKTLLPWEKPEDAAIDVPITFDPAKYAPLFLPLPMAYGHPMKIAEFNDFLKDPDKDSGRGLTLRLRPSIKPGSIAAPDEPMPPETATEFEALNKDRKDNNDKSKNTDATSKNTDATTEDIKKTLGAEAAEYLIPKDAGDVLLADGSVMPPDQVAAQLPRLKSAVLRLHVVRRGKLKEWTIYHFGLMHSVLVEGDREIPLMHDRPPEEPK